MCVLLQLSHLSDVSDGKGESGLGVVRITGWPCNGDVEDEVNVQIKLPRMEQKRECRNRAAWEADAL